MAIIEEIPNPELISRIIFGLHDNANDLGVIAIVLKDESNIKIPLSIENIRWVSQVKKEHHTKVLSLNRLSKQWLKVCAEEGLIETTQWDKY